jgi:glycosidase
MIFYGSEIGLLGEGMPGNRQAMNWDEACWDRTILNAVRELTAMRHSHPALCRGDIVWVESGHSDVVAYTRSYEQSWVFVVINRGDSEVEVTLPEGCEIGYDPSRNVTVRAAVTVPARGYTMLEAPKEAFRGSS